MKPLQAPYGYILLRAFPKPIYLYLKNLCETHGATQWQVLIAALAVLGKTDPQAIADLMDDIKVRYPSRATQSESAVPGRHAQDAPPGGGVGR